MSPGSALASWPHIDSSADTPPADSATLPQTFLFRTFAREIGLLQITGFTENPRGVKIRYKLVQSGNPTNSP